MAIKYIRQLQQGGDGRSPSKFWALLNTSYPKDMGRGGSGIHFTGLGRARVETVGLGLFRALRN